MAKQEEGFGVRLRRLRLAKGFESMTALATASGLAPKTIELYEKGLIASPRYNSAVKLAKALKLSVDELLGGTDAA